MYSFLFTKTPLSFFIQSFWRDEAFTYLLAKRNISEIIALTAKDYNPPLYYILLHLWMRLFGGSEIAVRTLSLIFALAGIYVCFLFMTNVLRIKKSRSYFYLTLFIINPAINYYAFEGRMYTMFAFLACLSFYFYFRGRKKSYLFATILGLYTHYFMIFVIAAQIISDVFQRIDWQSRLKKNYLPVLIAFLPWAVYAVSQKTFLNGYFWIMSMPFKNIIGVPAVIYSGYEDKFDVYKNSLIGLSIIIFLIVGLGFLAGLIRKRRYPKRVFILLLSWSLFIPLIIFIVSFIKPIFLPRYLISSTIGLILLLIFILESLKVKLKNFFLALIFIFTLNYNQLQIKERKKENLKRVIGEIKMMAKPEDRLYVTSELNFHPAEYYFDENRVYIFGKPYVEIPLYVGKILIPKDKVVNTLPAYPRKAFILKDDLTYDIQAVY